MAQEITLFDLASKPPCKSWSFNPWKTRLALNYKSLPYKTHWLEFPDIAPHLQPLGIPPNTQGKPYTVPTIHLPSSPSYPDGENIMDSKAIAIALEAKYPEPHLHLDAPELGRAEELWMQLLRSLVGVFGPRVDSTLLNDRSREYTEANIHLEGKPDGDDAWASAKPMLGDIGALLKEKGGPYVLGETGEFKPHDLLLFFHLYTQIAVSMFVADV
ncbi:MAG: hypothetical protein Q9215_007399 [Flavoplaca cf. flavocitrina]